MALLVLENFTDFSAANLDGVTSKSGPGSITTGPRYGSKAAVFHNNEGATYQLTAGSTFRFAFRLLRASGVAVSRLIGFYEGGTCHAGLSVSADGYLSVFRNSSATLLKTTAAVAIPGDTWTHIEGKIVIADAGSAEIRIDGSDVVISESGTIDTKNAATGSCGLAKIHYAGGNAAATYTDLAIWDESGESPTGWIGDCRVDTLNPSGAGSSTQWTASAGSNYECVDEANCDDDTTYVETTTNGHKDLYALSNLPHTPTTIHAVMVTARAKKTDAASASIKLTLKSGSTTAQGSDAALTEGTYGRYFYARGVNPDTSAAWSKSDVDAIEAGIEAVL